MGALHSWGQLKNECVRLDPTCADDLRALLGVKKALRHQN